MTDNLRGDTICNGVNGKGCGEVVQVIIVIIVFPSGYLAYNMVSLPVNRTITWCKVPKKEILKAKRYIQSNIA